MATATEHKTTFRELDSRRDNDGAKITLVWNSETGDVDILVTECTGVMHKAKIEPSRALDAFYHPYCYLP